MLAVRPHRAIARNTRKNAGFTLLELIVVLLILGVLAAIAIPTFNLIQQNSVAGSLTTTGEAIVRNANAIAASEMTAGSNVSQAILEEAAAEALGGAPGTTTSWPSGWGGSFPGDGDAPSIVLTLASGNISCSLTISKPADGNELGKVAITTAAAC